VIPEDVKFVAPHVLSHRVMAESAKAVENLLAQLPVPLETV
jgi:MoxR-like ATPase